VVDLTDLWTTQYASLVRLAFALVDSLPQAEEVVQEAFVRAMAPGDRVLDPGAYVRTCVVNLCRKELRRRAVRRRRPIPVEDEHVPPHARLLLDAVRALPPRRRAVVVLRFYEDCSTEEIGRVLSMRPSTVRATLRQALAQLQEVIEP
jgi:RNA polymerase sigma factor (sigma-70 family)